MGVIKQKIALESIRFFAHHGFYPEEQKLGNVFLLDIEAEMRVQENLSDELSETVNYERLFEIASTEMRTPRKLLETVAHSILKQVLQAFPSIESVKISVRKINPPLKAEVASSRVQLTYTS